MQAVNDRLQDNFQRRIAALSTDNTRTHEIKVKMNKFEEEKKEIRFATFYNKQLEHLKRMKKKEKDRNTERQKIMYKSMEKKEQVHNNKKMNDYKWKEFTGNVDDKFRKTVKPIDISQQVQEINETKLKQNQRKRIIQQREIEKAKQQIIEKHLQKIKKSEALQKKKEEIIHFSLLKQREML